MMKAHPNVETLHSVVSIYHMASSDLEALQNHYFCFQQMNPKIILQSSSSSSSSRAAVLILFYVCNQNLSLQNHMLKFQATKTKSLMYLAAEI
jgi:hypothetical protein